MMTPVRRVFTFDSFGCNVTGRTLAVAAALLCGASLACSFSYSSKGSSDSSNSSSDSSGSSSASSGSDASRFQGDVTHYTEAFVEAGGGGEQSFMSGLSDLARKRGVSDWESDPSTWEAVGRGLAKTNLNDAQRVAYESAWSDGDPTRRSAMDRGFAAAK